MADGTSEEVKPGRVLRKRTATKSAPRADGNSSAPRKRATRKRATRTATTTPKKVAKKKAEPKLEKTETATEEKTTRKAPTPLSAEKKEKRAMKIHSGVVAFILLIGVTSSAVIGYTDDGSINVNEVIENRNQKVRDSGSSDIIVPVQNTNQEPDGGLIGLGVGTPKATSTPVVETEGVASTTDETASSTAAIEEDEDSEGQVPRSSGEANAASSNTATSTSN